MEGIDVPAVTAWMAEAVPFLQAPLAFELIAGGRSNLTYRVTDAAGTSVALRRPPVSHVLPTAHDMKREYTVISALGAHRRAGPRAPRPLYRHRGERCPLLRDVVRGRATSCGTSRPPRSSARRSRGRASDSIVDTLAALHEVDIDRIGLGEFGRREGYIARQLKRWHGQFTQSTVDGTPGPAVIDRVHELLAERIPEQQGVGIVHGDYRLDNTVLGDDGSVRAVLDWEICTLGDPLADLGLLLVYWTEPGDARSRPSRRGPDRTARASPPVTNCATATPPPPGGTSRASPSTGPSASGSWPASSRACTPATPVARPPATGRVPTCSPTTWAPWASSPWPGGGVAVTDGPRSPLYRIDPAWGEPPGGRVHDPVLVVALDGLGRRRTRVVGSHRRAPGRLAHRRGGRLRHRGADRPAGAGGPIARLVDGVTESLTWPALRILAGKDRVGADILYLTGPEPDFHWRSFTDAVTELVRALGVRMVVGLGAFPAPTPHTRPVRLASTVPPESTELTGRVGFVQGTIEVPAGVQSALEVALGSAGVPVIGLWARVPHYVAAMPFPEASAALIEGLCALTGLVLDTSSLRAAGEASRRQVDELISGNAEHTEMVRRLETSLDSEEGQPDPFGIQGGVPSGDEIAAELEQFLRGEGN